MAQCTFVRPTRRVLLALVLLPFRREGLIDCFLTCPGVPVFGDATRVAFGVFWCDADSCSILASSLAEEEFVFDAEATTLELLDLCPAPAELRVPLGMLASFGFCAKSKPPQTTTIATATANLMSSLLSIS